VISISIQAAAFDVAEQCRALRASRTDIGALLSFTGLVRDYPMTLEHYPALGEAQLRSLADEAAARWPILGGRIIHRYGPLMPGDEIVLVAIASRHRQTAFDAANFLMDWLKTRAPFWKSEDHGSGRNWVSARTEDIAAADRWHQPPVHQRDIYF
jgi:molybdopterin synthase catalytic subunit